MAQDTGRSPGNHIPTGRMASSGIGNRAEKAHHPVKKAWKPLASDP